MLPFIIMQHPVMLLKDFAQGHCIDFSILSTPVRIIC